MDRAAKGERRSQAQASGQLSGQVLRGRVAPPWARPQGVPSYLLHCERSSGRYLFDAVMSVGHDFGIEIDGFRVPGI